MRRTKSRAATSSGRPSRADLLAAQDPEFGRLHDRLADSAGPALLLEKAAAARGDLDSFSAAEIGVTDAVPETIEALGKHEDRYAVTEIPHYAEMIRRACRMIDHDPEEFRVFRLRMAYPVPGFQFVMAFDAPAKPERLASRK